MYDYMSLCNHTDENYVLFRVILLIYLQYTSECSQVQSRVVVYSKTV